MGNTSLRLRPGLEEVTFDKDGYPTEETLDRIAKCESIEDTLQLMVESWDMVYGSYDIKKDGRHTFATGGWSGNESVMGAAMRNFVFWSWTWVSSHRGGKYQFKMDIPCKEEK